MTRPLSELEKAFLEDHRCLTRGLTALVEALEKKDLVAAARLADELDREVGPHMLFEEKWFYPLLRDLRGAEATSRLYHEHGTGLAAIEAIRKMGTSGSRAELSEEAREEVVHSVRCMLDHAISCGSLLSYLSALPGATHEKLLEKLEELRGKRMRWSEIGTGEG